VQRIAYVIPAFNEGRVIGEVVASLRRDAPRGAIIVVDDASGDSTGQAARDAGAIVVRHPINRGQGAALQTGFDAALRLGAEVVVTFDADGQHRAEDVRRMVEELERSGADVALASRFAGEGSNLPAGRRVLLRLALLFTRIVSRIRVSDTHNGLRAFRASALARIRISEDRMAHASELLDLIATRGLRYVEVPCAIRYTDYSMEKGQRWTGAPRILFDFLLGKLFR
jgi:glycosyltransferase involved in cell wall biosynthesis